MTDIDEIKSRIDIADFIGKRVVLKKAGRNFKGLCPFHSERTPSFMVSPDRQSFHCFGCGKGGSVFDFVMEYEHVDFREALEELADLTGVTLTKQVGTTPQEKQKDDLLVIHHLAAEYYQFLLVHHDVGEKAREYIKKRGVSEKTMKAFGMGYSANSWDGLSKYLKKKGYDEKILEDSGLLIPSNRGGYDRFRGRLMFPLRNHRGQTVGFSGRLLDPEVKEAKYINSPETQLYKKGEMVFALDITKANIQKEQAVVVMEGEFDVISSFQAGIGNIVAIKGTALTEQQVYLLKRFASKIIFALDGDIAGDHASQRGIAIAEKVGLEIHVVQLPEGKDPDDIARSEPHVLKKAISEAQSIYDYYFSSIEKQVDMNSAYGKKQMGDKLFPVLLRIENSIIQAHYVKKLANTLSVSEQTIADGMRKARLKMISPNTEAKDTQTPPHLDEHQQDIYVLALLLQGDPSFVLKTPTLPLEALHSLPVQKIITRLSSAVGDSSFSLPDFLKEIPEEWGSIVDQAMAWDTADIVEQPDQLQREWALLVKELTKRYLKEMIHTTTNQQKTASEEEVERLSTQIGEYAHKLRHLEKPQKT